MATPKKPGASKPKSAVVRGARPQFGPSVEFSRQRGAYTAFGYNSATVASKDGRSPTAGSGDFQQEWDRERLVLQARDFQRNNGIFSGMIDRASAYVVGNGFCLQARTADEAWNSQVEALWKEFWLLPEIRGIQSGEDVEQLICSELMTCGDAAVIKTDRGLLQLIESEQIKGTGAALDGIKKDRYGRPLKFNVCPYTRAGAPDVSKAVPVDPADILFITRPTRPSSTRAVPPCQAVFPMLHRINDVCDSEAVAWQMLSRVAISVTRSNAGLNAFTESKADDTLSAADQDGRAAVRVTELDYALIFNGEPGDEVKGVDRNIPGKDFSASLNMFFRLLGLPLGLPLEVILLDWTKSNYSQSRAVLEQAYVTFRRWQAKLQRFFHAPVYRWFVDMKIRSRELKDLPDKYRHEWIKPSFPWIDQLKEAQAYAAKLDRSFCSHSDVLKSLDRDRKEVVDTVEAEVRDAIARAKKIKDDTGVEVPWQPFCGQAVPQVAPAAAPPADDATTDAPIQDKTGG